MAREPVAIDLVGLGGGMRVEHGSSREGNNHSRLVRPVPGVPANVHQLSMSTSSAAPEGFRNWLNRVDTSTTPGLCRSNQHIMASSRLRSKENSGVTTADDSRNITEDHSVNHTLVTNTELASTQVPLVDQSLPQPSVEEANTTAVHSFARPHSNIGKHPGTAQLTVFYAGMVNVYDEVPFDKAQAIMVLAGRARTWASSNNTDVLSGSCVTERVLPVSIAMNHPVSRAGSPSPQLTNKLECAPNVKRPKTIATRVELPQARKASLARFLERRKDRLRGGPYTSVTHNVTTMRPNRAAPNSSWLSSPRHSMSQNSSAMTSPSRSNGE